MVTCNGCVPLCRHGACALHNGIEHLVRSAPPERSLTTSSSKMLAMFVALALPYGCDGYFFDGYYGGATWRLLQQIGTAFRF